MKRHALALAVSLVVAIAVAAYGYAFFFGTIPSTSAPIPWSVSLAVPFVMLGPAYPSVAQFVGIAIANVVAWWAIVFVIVSLVYRRRRVR